MRRVFAFTILTAATNLLAFSTATNVATPEITHRQLGVETYSFDKKHDTNPKSDYEHRPYETKHKPDKPYSGYEHHPYEKDSKVNKAYPKYNSKEYYHEPTHVSKYDDDKYYHEPNYVSKYDDNKYYHEPNYVSKYDDDKYYYEPKHVSKEEMHVKKDEKAHLRGKKNDDKKEKHHDNEGLLEKGLKKAVDVKEGVWDSVLDHDHHGSKDGKTTYMHGNHHNTNSYPYYSSSSDSFARGFELGRAEGRAQGLAESQTQGRGESRPSNHGSA